MLPASRSLPQALLIRLRAGRTTALSAVLAALVAAGQASAQDMSQEMTGPPLPLPAPVPQANPGQAEAGQAETVPIDFEADRVDYHDDGQTVVASGNVLLRHENQSARADTITWNSQTGQIVAEGNVRLVDEDGNQLFTERVELTDELRAGAMANLLLALREGGRLAANSGQRLDNGDVRLDHAAYTSCEVEDSQGCAKKPSWRITAREVLYNPEARQVRFSGARLEVFQVVKLPLPGLMLRTDGSAVTGFLIPDFRSSPSNGVEISDTWYWRLAENRDLSATAHVYTDVPPMGSVQYRALTRQGAYQITGYVTESRRIPINGIGPRSQRDFRGYLFANGRYQVTPNWSVTASIRSASDRTFLRRYDISRDDRLRSMVEIERIGPKSYFSASGWATQTLRFNEGQGQVPIALPLVDYRRRLTDPVLGGKVELQFNSLAVTRTQGQDTQRAFASARWERRRITGLGQEFTLTALARGDIYHSGDNALTATESYRGLSGWRSRAVATAAADFKWPLVGPLLGGTQVLTPRIQLVASPSIRNLAVPNEDARSIDLEDSNLFALNRFPGYDRIEDGVRVTYGIDWQFERPRWRIKTTIGQSLRVTRDRTLLPDGTGLAQRVSDIVGRTEVRYRDFINLTHRFRLDKDSFAIRRNEFDATIGNHRTYAQVGYVKLNRDVTAQIEDLQNREELRAAGRVAFARYWSLFGSAVVNLTDRREDPSKKSDGFQPLRTRVGVAYDDDCLEIALTWRRDYVGAGDARRGNSFQIHFALRNLGFR